MNVPAALIKARYRFEKVTSHELRFVSSLPQLIRRVATRHYPLQRALRERLCEMSFLLIFTAWEEFLESTFELFLVSERKLIQVVRQKIHVNNVSTAREVIRGERRQYVDWADPDVIRNRAKIFFKDGEPYESAVGTALFHLKRMRIIRNHTVHRSKFAAEQFSKMIREVYGYGRRITSGGFLLDSPPAGAMPYISGSRHSSMFELFTDVLSSTCAQIVPLGIQ